MVVTCLISQTSGPAPHLNLESAHTAITEATFLVQRQENIFVQSGRAAVTRDRGDRGFRWTRSLETQRYLRSDLVRGIIDGSLITIEKFSHDPLI